jgi:hypothetical protein
MLTQEKFRRMALAMEDAIESAHMGHPDFRVHGKIFATLSYPDTQRGMVALTPDQQQQFVRHDPQSFAPASGAWGRGGSTMVQLALVDEETLGEAMTLAWQNAKERVAARSKTKRAARPTRPSRKR